MERKLYSSFPSNFDTFTIIWIETKEKVLIKRIFLSDPRVNSEIKAQNTFPNRKLNTSPIIDSFGIKIQEFLNGNAEKFDKTYLDFSECNPFQKKVLETEATIPRGKISTYKRIAVKIGTPKGARAVGNALANNPFPIIIPCHRAIKSNGEIGGFQGGNKMKRKLLEFEGLQFSNTGKVVLDKIYF